MEQSILFRRIVTGHDPDGKAVVIADAPPTHQVLVGGPGGPTFTEVWHTLQTPAPITAQPDLTDEGKLTLAPPAGGTRIRVIDFPPEGKEIKGLSSTEAAEKFASMGGATASTNAGTAPHPLMHRTKTVDYGIVLEGEMTMILDKSETVIKAGDIIVQNGTNHAWANRSGKPCRMAFVLIDGVFTGPLTS